MNKSFDKLSALYAYLNKNNFKKELSILKSYAAEIFDFMQHGGNPLESALKDLLLIEEGRDFYEDGSPIKENLVISELFLKSGYDKFIKYINTYSKYLDFIKKNHLYEGITEKMNMVLTRLRFTKQMYQEKLSKKKLEKSKIEDKEHMSGIPHNLKMSILDSSIIDIEQKIEVTDNLYLIIDSLLNFGENISSESELQDVIDSLKEKGFFDISSNMKSLLEDVTRNSRNLREDRVKMKKKLLKEREPPVEEERPPSELYLVEEPEADPYDFEE